MGIYGNIWEYMGIYGNICEYMGIYRIQEMMDCTPRSRAMACFQWDFMIHCYQQLDDMLDCFP
jgi:hypothetical protein